MGESVCDEKMREFFYGKATREGDCIVICADKEKEKECHLYVLRTRGDKEKGLMKNDYCSLF